MHRLRISDSEEVKVESPYFSGLHSQEVFSSTHHGSITASGAISPAGATILSMVYIDPLCSNRVPLLHEKYQYRSQQTEKDNENKLKSIDHFLEVKKKKPKTEPLSSDETAPSTSTPQKLSLECSVCQKSFSRTFDLRRHEATHTGKKPYKCDICEKYFKQKAHLQKHQLIHLRMHDIPIVHTDASAVGIDTSPVSPVTIETIEVVDTDAGSSSGPMASGSTREQYPGASGSSISKILNGGNRGRSGVGGAYACTECEKVFSSKFSLERHHRNVHSGYRPYGCDICSKHFQQKTHLKKHISSVHTSNEITGPINIVALNQV